jgi:hypothetical protein
MSGTSLPDLFEPNYNPEGLPEYASGVAPVPFPDIDLAAYRTRATDVLRPNTNLRGRIALGTREQPALLYAEGNLGTGDQVEFDGWGILVVEGTFHIDHRIRTVGDELQSQLLVVAASNAVVRRDGLDIAGFWYVGGNLSLRSNTRLVGGGYMVEGQYRSTGPVEIAYQQPVLPLLEVAWPDHLIPITSREW